MELSVLLAFSAVAALLVISPGPNGLLVAKSTYQSGKRAAYLNIIGFTVGFYLHGSLSILGISVLIIQSGLAFALLKSLGAAYLIWIGVKALKNALKSNVYEANPRISTSRHRQSDKAAFVEGLLTNTLNPKVSLFYLAAFPQFLSVGDHPIIAYLLVTAHVFINVVWFVSLANLLNISRNNIIKQNAKRCLDVITGITFVSFGIKLALSKHN